MPALADPVPQPTCGPPVKYQVSPGAKGSVSWGCVMVSGIRGSIEKANGNPNNR